MSETILHGPFRAANALRGAAYARVDVDAGASGEHAAAQRFVATWSRTRFDREPCPRWPGGWRIHSGVQVEYEPNEVCHHDVAGWRRARTTAMPPSGPIRTPPDWVCEILSRGDERRDRIDKMSVLHAAGVPHYWLLDYVEQVLAMYRHTPAGYLLAASSSTDATLFVEPFEATPLCTNILFGLEDDED